MLYPSVKRVLLAVALVGAMTSPSFAATYFDLDINVGPPAARYEAVPVARPGYVWAPGHWEWDRGRHIWVGGMWVAERPGYRWVSAKWIHHGNRWGYTRGTWVADPHWDHNRDWHERHEDRDHDDWDHGNHRGWDRH